ncbi:hypothetical protein SAMN04489724_0109 [Algoriphagus locisalis]|uniref:Uncharacterized protein n=1 Tax=Algoriphagus locisalis TaxID=305507 RepID=A0A1I7E5H7_9BACT|nr:hypothetical protein [Algoriphagus locisalis]SFU19155.1 hypothetical protein SAMN04489724_0109 [Algoriphagus locisalis]
MLENISWGVFFKLLGIVLTCYYGVVVIRYFRADVFAVLLKGKRVGLPGCYDKNREEPKRSSMDSFYALLEELDAELMGSAGTKAEFIQLLRQKVGQYGLPESNGARKILLNHLLLAAKAGQVDLEEGDLLDLFNALPN